MARPDLCARRHHLVSALDSTGSFRYTLRMSRANILELLRAHTATTEHEAGSLARMIAFVEAHEDCCERSFSEGHLTGSAWIVDESGERALLTLHRKLGLWLQLGGHADGDTDLLRVAMREAEEESGLNEIAPVTRAIFDVDVHEIPARKSEAAHLHYDVRFLLRARSAESLRVSDESIDLRWVGPEEIEGLTTDASVRRMRDKWVCWHRDRQA